MVYNVSETMVASLFKTSQPVAVTVTPDKGKGFLSMLADTGVDTTTKGLDHLHDIDLIPDDHTKTTDGSLKAAADSDVTLIVKSEAVPLPLPLQNSMPPHCLSPAI